MKREGAMGICGIPEEGTARAKALKAGVSMVPIGQRRMSASQYLRGQSEKDESAGAIKRT